MQTFVEIGRVACNLGRRTAYRRKQEIRRLPRRTDEIGGISVAGDRVALRIARGERDVPDLPHVARTRFDDPRGRRILPHASCIQCLAVRAQQGERCVARPHGLVRAAQAIDDEIHHAQARPRGVVVAFDLHRQDDDGVARLRRDGVGLRPRQMRPCEEGGDREERDEGDRIRKAAARLAGNDRRDVRRAIVVRGALRARRFFGARFERRCRFDDRRLDSRRFDNDRFHHRDLFAEHLDVHRPAEPEPRHGADRALLLSVVADRAPRAQHDLRQLRIGDIGPAEDGAHEFVAADGAVAVFDQGLQAFEDARGQRLRHAVQAELASREVEHARTETVAGGSRLGAVSHGVEGQREPPHREPRPVEREAGAVQRSARS